MKKLISVLLCILTALPVFVFSASAEDTPLEITVANDLHINYKAATAAKVAKRNNLSVEYAHASSGGQLPYESIAIIKAFLEKAGSSSSKFVLIPGDLTNGGTAEENAKLSEMLSDFESTYSKQVFVVPGNHDYFASTVADFKSDYAQFGYNEAITVDEKTASYTAELDGKYRLLAIDSCDPGQSPEGVTAETVQWIKTQCEKAKADGKYLIAMMHHNLIDHFVLASKIHKGSVVSDNTNKLADILSDGGVKYIFTGHTHEQDIAAHTSAAGNVIYDVVTTSMNAYPCAYREVSFGENVEIRTNYVQKIDTSLLPAGIHETALALAEENFLLYAKNCTYIGIESVISSYTKAKQLKSLLDTDDEKINSLIDNAGSKLEKAASMPLYIKDETVEGESIEALAAAQGITLPKTGYENLIKLVVRLYQAHAEGDEHYPAYSDEMILLSRALAVAINYCFSDVSDEDFIVILSFVASLLGADISDDIINAVGGVAGKLRGSELFVTSVILPLLAEYGEDKAPSDNNVTLPGYSTSAPAKSFLDEIRDFFKRIFDFFHMLFAMIA